MMTFAAVFVLFMFGFGFMAAMLKFSQFRERENELCCTDALDEELDDCDTCPRKDTYDCELHNEMEKAKKRKLEEEAV